MKPSMLAMVAAAQSQLSRQIGAAPPELVGLLRGIKTILNMLSRDWDTGVRDTVAEIVQLGQLLTRGAEIAPAPLSTELSDAAAAAVVSFDLPLSALEAIHDQLTEATIDLQAWLEEAGSADALTLSRDLDAYMFAAVKRQVLEGSKPW